jgi:hypothetical protein
MSEIQRLDELKADAERAADLGLRPQTEKMKYEPNLRGIWMTHYAYRVAENERRVAA